MRRYRFAALLFCCSALLASPTWAIPLVADGRAEFPYDTELSDLAWELRTPGGSFVHAEWNDVVSNANYAMATGKHQSITAANAASSNIDWAAWSAAVVDPAYTILRVYRNGVFRDLAFPSAETAPNRASYFRLDEFRMTIGYPQLPAGANDRISIGTGFFYDTTPEPTTIIMLFVGLLHVSACSNVCRSRPRR